MVPPLHSSPPAAPGMFSRESGPCGVIMRTPFLITALLLVVAAPALAAEEPSGCDKFKWPIERERAALTAPDRAKLASGGDQAALPPSGFTLALVAPGDAKLPSPPERAPKDGTFAGFANFRTAPKA